MSKKFDVASLQDNWGPVAGTEWVRLKDAQLKKNMSEAHEWIFRRILRLVDPKELIGEMCFDGTIHEVPHRFEHGFYCGFLWKHPKGGMFCAVKISKNIFFVEQVYEGSEPPADNRVQYVQR